MKTINSLLGNGQRLDGGAMFGNVPQAMWSKWVMPDELNRIELSCRSLLVQDGDKLILFETGIGAFFAPKYRERYGVIGEEHLLLSQLAKHGLSDSDIDLVVLSHLHFDHAGGLLSAWQDGKAPKLLFPAAKYLVSKMAWGRAVSPHPRDKTSYIPELQELLDSSGRLELIDADTSRLLGKDYKFHISHGHSPGMLLTEICFESGPLIFAADLIPGTAWVHLPVTMGYDRYPELLIDEKLQLLEYIANNNGRLFYTHDPKCAVSGVERVSGKFTAIEREESLQNRQLT